MKTATIVLLNIVTAECIYKNSLATEVKSSYLCTSSLEKNRIIDVFVCIKGKISPFKARLTWMSWESSSQVKAKDDQFKKSRGIEDSS